MKAYTYESYGAENLQISEVEIPAPGKEEVLVKIYTTAINDFDWSMVIGKPFLYRLMFGLRRPKYPTPGMELSGIVEAVGEKVTKFKPGDAVYGDTSEFGFGTFAEYIAINEKALILKPEGISFDEAATISHASMLALQGLKDVGNIQDGQSILINGAGGGVGTFALQIAKMHNAEVTGVDTGDKLRRMKEIGFDHIIDYKKENFTRSGKKYDLILDTKTVQAPYRYTKSLSKNGIYVTVGGSLGKLFRLLIFKGIIKLFTGKSLKILALKPNQGLEYIHDLYQQGKIFFVVDGPYSFEQLPDQLSYFGNGLHTGKVVIKTGEEPISK